jgi:medium-chain acyl-[acyl-carrier-protein] hydrolase
MAAIQLPGRAARWREQPYTHVDELLPALADAILPFLDRPFAFFGFSLGAFVSFELAQRLRRQHGMEPLHLFVAGQRAPHLTDPDPPLRRLADAEFVDAIRRRYNGVFDDVVQSVELMRIVLISLRADFAMSETYTYRPVPPLTCPITAYGGLQDDSVSAEEMTQWRDHTDGRFARRTFPGDHFFVQSSRAPVLRAIAEELRGCLRPMGARSEASQPN